MTRSTTALVLAGLLSLGALGACRRKPAPAPVPEAVLVDGNAKLRADSIAAAEAARRRAADSLAALNAERSSGAAQRAQAELTQVLTQRVYFDYDRDALRDDARQTLDAKAPILLANASVTLVITGHTDERGTSEYNLALGQRRAAQVKRYLVSKGVADGKLTTQSLGDSQPAVQGSDESAYQQNRRAEFELQNSRGALVRPGS